MQSRYFVNQGQFDDEWDGSGGGLEYVAGDKPEYNHDSVDEILSRWSAILLPAEGGEDEEHGQPDDQFIAGEHAERAQQQGNKAGAIRLVLGTRESCGVVVVDVFIVLHFLNNIIIPPLSNITYPCSYKTKSLT